MKRTILIFSLSLLVFACDKDEKEQPAPSRTELLTGGSQKSWYQFLSTPDDCASSGDNTWTFFADGTLAYDHGTVTKDEAGECGDFINFEGTWAFSEEETMITIVALRPTGSTEEIEPYTIGPGTITTLTNDRLVITTVEGSVEFRKE